MWLRQLFYPEVCSGRSGVFKLSRREWRQWCKVQMATVTEQTHQLEYLPELNFVDEKMLVVNIMILLVYSGGFRNAFHKFVLLSKIHQHLIHHFQHFIDIIQTLWTIDHNSFKTSSQEWREEKYWYSITPIRSVHSVCELSVLEITQAISGFEYVHSTVELLIYWFVDLSICRFVSANMFLSVEVGISCQGTSLGHKRQNMKWTNAKAKWHSLTNCEIVFGRKNISLNLGML
jgi:hypothetical protein